MSPPSQRKQQKDLLAALQKVVVPIYCTSFLAVEEEKQQKITRVNTEKHIHTVVWFCILCPFLTFEVFLRIFSLGSNINMAGH